MGAAAKWSALALGLAAAVLLVACAREDAAGPNPGGARETRVRGTVTVSRDDGGRLQAVTVTSNSGTIYVVELDKQGERLAAKMDGQAARITGVVVEAEGENRLTVTSFRAADPPAPAPTTAAEATGDDS
jgi:hypothetical protein